MTPGPWIAAIVQPLELLLVQHFLNRRGLQPEDVLDDVDVIPSCATECDPPCIWLPGCRRSAQCRPAASAGDKNGRRSRPRVTPPATQVGEISYVCGMNMLDGRIVVR